VTHATEQILGIRFFHGTPAEAVREIARGGLLVAPSGTCFERFLEDAEYRRAIINADVALADSGLMVILWRLLRGRRVPRISGLTYLQELFRDPEFWAGQPLWVLPHAGAKAKLIDWAQQTGHPVDPVRCYIAPRYGMMVVDETLGSLINDLQPRDVVIAIGAGAQEKLGWFLREHLAARPAIHCIGGALGFITGDQVPIPAWADRLYLGWLLRLLSQPRVFIPRLWRGRLLPWLILRYGEGFPPVR
jgi:UDP-N-acetyl-D-mannosaminuronic acid transferase (WecB/TagA/CpsF family)